MNILNEKHSKILREIKEKIYSVSYFVGTMFLRKALHTFLFLKRAFKKLGAKIWLIIKKIIHALLKVVDALIKEISDSAKTLYTHTKDLLKQFNTAKKQGGVKFAFKTVSDRATNLNRELKHNLSVVLSYLLPVLAVVVLAVAVNANNADEYVVKVSYGNTTLGYVANETVFFTGQQLAQERLVYSQDEDAVYYVPRFEMEKVGSDEHLLDAYQVCDMLIRNTDDFVEATGLYINGNLIAVTSNGIALKKQLDDILLSNWSGIENETVDFYDDVELRDGAYPEGSLISTDEMKQLVHSNTKQEKIYTIVAGDAPIKIAQKNGITLSELRALNPEIDTVCLIGQKVLVNASEPLIKVKTMVTLTEEVQVPYQTISTSSPTYSYGYKKTVTKGENGVASQTVVKTYVDGFITDTQVLSTTVIRKPVTEKVLVGTYVSSSLQASTGSGEYEGQFVWPVRWGGYLTCGINGYKGHTGIDIGGVPYGTEIVAAAPGVVIKAYKGWTGYGHYIIIDHGNGVQTLYAHNRKLYVKAGDVVEQGEVIAVIGETGNAYGQHLHFEIRMNGQYINATKYIGTYYGQVVTNKIKK